jgi:hypothetical protein
MAKDNKVVTFKRATGGSAMTTATQEQIQALRDADRLEAVRRVRSKFGGTRK